MMLNRRGTTSALVSNWHLFIQGRLCRAGYDFSLDATINPCTSSLRVPVSIPKDFKYNVDEWEEEVDEVPDVLADGGGKEKKLMKPTRLWRWL